jgi:3' exoribonuclease, RNase T-like
MSFLFCDTEFTDFKNTELMSIGIVTEDGQHEFYREVQHIADFRSDFVNQVVVPLMNHDFKHPDVVALDLKDWIDALPYPDITFIVDYVGDYTLMDQLFMKQRPQKKMYAQMMNQGFLHMLHSRGIHTQEQLNKGFKSLTNEIETYFKIDPRQHHALVDAKANRHGWLKGYEAAK